LCQASFTNKIFLILKFLNIFTFYSSPWHLLFSSAIRFVVDSKIGLVVLHVADETTQSKVITMTSLTKPTTSSMPQQQALGKLKPMYNFNWNKVSFHNIRLRPYQTCIHLGYALETLNYSWNLFKLFLHQSQIMMSKIDLLYKNANQSYFYVATKLFIVMKILYCSNIHQKKLLIFNELINLPNKTKKHQNLWQWFICAWSIKFIQKYVFEPMIAKT